MGDRINRLIRSLIYLNFRSHGIYRMAQSCEWRSWKMFIKADHLFSGEVQDFPTQAKLCV